MARPKLLFLGDLCIEDDILPCVSDELMGVISSYDIVSVNFEGPINDSNKKIKSPKVGPGLSQSNLVLPFMESLGINLLAMANNHIMDSGSKGLRDTLGLVNGYMTVGAGTSFDSAYKANFIDLHGCTIAVLAFSEAQFGAYIDEATSKQDAGGYAWVGHPMARKAVRDASEKADYTLVQVHAGLEMVGLPLPEWRSCYRELIDFGADLIVGHHPHVIQGYEKYREGGIYYSVGNFYMSRMASVGYAYGGGVGIEIGESGIETTFIPLENQGKYVDIDLSGKISTEFDQLSSVLCSTKATVYMKEIDRICEEYWSLYYSKYYAMAMNGVGLKWTWSGLLLMLKFLVKKIFFLDRSNWVDRALMIVHNSRIESHRWVIDRALSNRCSNNE